MISDLTILVLIHFISDFFLQPGKWAEKKLKYFKPLLYHSIQYTIPFLIAFYFMNISLFWGFWIFGTHLTFDNKKALDWWNKFKGQKNTPAWVIMIQDQIIHLITIAIIFIF